MIRPLFTALLAAVDARGFRRFARGARGQEDEPRVIDGIAAVVNGEVITYSQVRGSPRRANGSCARNSKARSWRSKSRRPAKLRCRI